MIVLTFKHPRVPRDVQERDGRAYFAGFTPRVWHVGKVPPSWKQIAAEAMPGDTIWVYALVMIPADRRTIPRPLAAQFTAFMSELPKGVVLVEGSTGRKSSIRKQRDEMIDETHRLLSRAGKRLPKNNKRPGRPRLAWPSETVKDKWQRAWRSKNYASDAAVVREAKLEGVTERMVRSLGPSGRNA